jgi:hypothetical protein
MSGGSRRHVGGGSRRRLSRGSEQVRGGRPYIPCMRAIKCFGNDPCRKRSRIVPHSRIGSKSLAFLKPVLLNTCEVKDISFSSSFNENMVQPVVSNLPRSLKFGCHDTRRNLPAASSSKRGEANFLAKFERVYLASELRDSAGRQRHATGREFALEGFGRADLLFMAWQTGPQDEEFSALALKNLRVTAIEAKLKDWRKGLMQASRYRFFANRSLLVLPTETAAVALVFLETFRALNVGLWEFDTNGNVLRRHFTPRSGKPLNAIARDRAIRMISKRLQFGKSRKCR